MTTIRFTITQANAMLPLVRSIVRDLVSEMSEMTIVERKYLVAQQGRASSEKIERLRNERKEISDRIDGYVRELRALGLEVIDLEHGWVVFPTQVGTKEARFCWEPHDDRVAFWQLADKSFAERHPVQSWM